MPNEIDLIKEFEGLKNAIKNAATELENFMTKAKGDGTGNFKGQEEALNRIISLEKQLIDVQQKLINLSKQNTTSKTAEAQAQAQYENALRKQSVLNQEIQTETVKITQAIKDKTRALREDYMLANASPYEKLKNEVRLASIAYMNMAASLGVNDIKVVEAQKSLGLLNEKLSRIEQNAGNWKRNVGNYSSATFTLTQVLREAPAFAYGAQIGFGALSNNLVPLAASFQEVAKSVNTATGKINGAWGAFKIFGAQLLGLNAILSIAVLIMTMYGKEIGNFVKGMFDAAEATDAAALAQQGYNEQMENAESVGNKLKTKLVETKAILEVTKDVLEKGAKGNLASYWDNITRSLNLVKSTLGSKLNQNETSFIEGIENITNKDEKLKAVQKGLDIVNKYQDLIVNATNKQSAAQEKLNNITKLQAEIDEQRNKSVTKLYGISSDENIAKFESVGIKLNKQLDDLKSKYTKDGIFDVQSYGEAVYKAQTNWTGAELAYNSYQNKIYTNQKKINEYQKAANILIYDAALAYDTIDNKKGLGNKQREEKSYKAEEDHYNRLIILLNSYSQTLLDIANNELASFDSRTNAANTWFNNNQELYIEELKLEKAKNKTIYEEALESLEKTKAANIKNGYDKLEQEEKFNKNLNIIKNNQLLANQKADDEWYKKSISNEKSRTDKLLNIAEDYYKVLEEKRKEDLSRQDRELNDKEIEFNNLLTSRLIEQKIYFSNSDKLIQESENKRTQISYSKEVQRIENINAGLLKEKEAIIKNYDEIAGISKEKDYDLLKKKIDAQAEADKERLKHSGLTDVEIAEKSKEIDEQAIKDKESFSNSITSIETRKAEKIKDINKQITDNAIDLKNKELKEEERIAKEKQKIAEYILKEEEKLNRELLESSLDLISESLDSIYEIKYQKLQKEKDLYTTIEDEKNKEIDDKLKAGVLSEEQAEEQKAANKAYYQSVQDDLDKKKAEGERQQFLISQAFAIADIWIKQAQTISAYELAKAEALTLPIVGEAMAARITALEAISYGIAAAQTAVIIAQTIPQFKDGVKDFDGGLAIVNDGRKDGNYVKEVIEEPNRTYMLEGANIKKSFPKGTNIYPNINAYEKEKSLSLFYSVNDKQFSDKMIIKELREQTRVLSNNKPIINKNNAFDLISYASKMSNKKTNPLIR